jgi:protein TonB
MLNKKMSKSKSEGKKSLSLLLGFVCALSFLFVIFEWSSEKKTVAVPIDFSEFVEYVVLPPQTMPERPPAPLPPKLSVLTTPPATASNFNPVTNSTGTEPTLVPNPEPDGDPIGVPYVPYIPIDEPPVIVDFLPSEDMPKFPGNLLEYLARNIRYPVIDQENNISGRVIVQFVVDTDGSITDLQIVRGVSPTIDREARRVVESMPQWSPGMQRGRPVKVRYTLPIVFALK